MIDATLEHLIVEASDKFGALAVELNDRDLLPSNLHEAWRTLEGFARAMGVAETPAPAATVRVGSALYSEGDWVPALHRGFLPAGTRVENSTGDGGTITDEGVEWSETAPHPRSVPHALAKYPVMIVKLP